MESTYYKHLIESAPFGFAHHRIILDAAGKPIDYEFLEVNPAFERLTGLLAADIIDKPVTSVIPGIREEKFDWIGYYGDLALNGGEKNFEQFFAQLGKWYKVQVYSPEALYFSTIFMDITTEKKQTEELENFFSVNLDLLCIADTEGNFIKTNEAWVEILGYATADLNHQNFLDFVHPDDMNSTLAAMKDLENQKKVLNFINRYRCKNGNYRYIEWRSFPQGKHIYAAARDITDRIENVQKIEESEQKYRLLTEFTSDVIWVLNLNRKCFTYISPAIFDLRGFTAEEALNESLEESMTADSVVAVQKAIAVNLPKFILEPKKPQFFLDQIQQPCKNGKIIWIEVSTKFRYNVYNEIEIVGMSRNIETRKKMERELVAAKEQAEKANRAKSEFLAIMSHELRTPLNSIIGFTDLLKESPLGKTQKLYIENIGTSGHSLLEIINDILDLSKIEAGKMELEFIETDIIELTEQTAEIIKFHSSKKNLEFLLDIDADVPRYATADPIRLKQILVNLLGNAVKFTHSGEVELSLSFNATDAHTGFFTFSVRDTGIGIAIDQQHKLFTAFSQADATTTRRFGGTGLGLTISNMLAGKMGSSIQFESGTDKGSRFFFTIETGFNSKKKREKESFAHLSRVLVIDDNAGSRRIIENLCGRWGIACTSVDNGLDALRLLEQHEKFDSIIVDYHMPYLGGIETVRQIQNLSGYRSGQLPVILLHNPSDNNDVEQECKKEGISFNLSKPVMEAELYGCFKVINGNFIASAQRFTQTKENATPVAGRHTAGQDTTGATSADILATLQALLEVNDLASIEWFERVKELDAYNANRASFDELERYISDLNFEKALYLLEGMQKG